MLRFQDRYWKPKRGCEPLHEHDFVLRAATMCRVSASAVPLACLGTYICKPLTLEIEAGTLRGAEVRKLSLVVIQ